MHVKFAHKNSFIALPGRGMKLWIKPRPESPAESHAQSSLRWQRSVPGLNGIACVSAKNVNYAPLRR
jgi:hypothetical protein